MPAMEGDSSEMTDEESAVLCTAYDETGALLATAHENGVLKLWVAGTGGCWDHVGEVQTAHEGQGAISALVFAPARLGTMLVTTGTDGQAFVHDVRGSRAAQALPDARAPLRSAAWASRGSLATLGDEGIARVYERVRGGRWVLSAALVAAEFPDVTGGSTAVRACALAFARGGQALYAGTRAYSRGRAGAWRATQLQGPEGDPPTCADWNARLALGRKDGSVLLCTNAGVVAKLRPPAAAAAVEAVQWDPAGAVLAAVHADGQVRTWARTPKRAMYGSADSNDSGDHLIEDGDASSGAWAWRLREAVKV